MIFRLTPLRCHYCRHIIGHCHYYTIGHFFDFHWWCLHWYWLITIVSHCWILLIRPHCQLADWPLLPQPLLPPLVSHIRLLFPHTFIIALMLHWCSPLSLLLWYWCHWLLITLTSLLLHIDIAYTPITAVIVIFRLAFLYLPAFIFAFIFHAGYWLHYCRLLAIAAIKATHAVITPLILMPLPAIILHYAAEILTLLPAAIAIDVFAINSYYDYFSHSWLRHTAFWIKIAGHWCRRHDTQLPLLPLRYAYHTH